MYASCVSSAQPICKTNSYCFMLLQFLIHFHAVFNCMDIGISRWQLVYDFRLLKTVFLGTFFLKVCLDKIHTQFEGCIPHDVIVISQTMCMFMDNDKQFSQIIRQIPLRSTYEFQLLNIFPILDYCLFFSILFILVEALQYCNINQITLSYITMPCKYSFC